MSEIAKKISKKNFKKKTSNKFSYNIPPIVSKTIEHIRKYGTKTEGIFRVSGNSSLVMDINKKFEKGEDVIFSPNEDIHVVSGLLRLYLREMNEPLISYELYESFIKIARGKFF